VRGGKGQLGQGELSHPVGFAKIHIFKAYTVLKNNQMALDCFEGEPIPLQNIWRPDDQLYIIIIIIITPGSIYPEVKTKR